MKDQMKDLLRKMYLKIFILSWRKPKKQMSWEEALFQERRKYDGRNCDENYKR